MSAGKKPKLAVNVPDPPGITEKDVERFHEEAKAFMESFRNGNKKNPVSRTGRCVFCGNTVIAHVVQELTCSPENVIIGPGSRSQYASVHKGFHCSECGLKYEFPPPGDIVKANKG